MQPITHLEGEATLPRTSIRYLDSWIKRGVLPLTITRGHLREFKELYHHTIQHSIFCCALGDCRFFDAVIQQRYSICTALTQNNITCLPWVDPALLHTTRATAPSCGVPNSRGSGLWIASSSLHYTYHQHTTSTFNHQLSHQLLWLHGGGSHDGSCSVPFA